jgi:hypothetical protein
VFCRRRYIVDLPDAQVTSQLRLKLLLCYSAVLPAVSRSSEALPGLALPQLLRLAMSELGLGKHGTSRLRDMLNRDDILLWGPQVGPRVHALQIGAVYGRGIVPCYLCSTPQQG